MKKKRRSRGMRRFLGHETLESRCLLAGLVGSPWQNPLGANDIDGNGVVSPLDALTAINAINAGTSGTLSGKVEMPGTHGAGGSFLDVTGDGTLSPLDALCVINALNDGTADDDSGTTDPTTADQPDKIGDTVDQLVLTDGFARVRAAIATDGDVDVFRVVASTDSLSAALFTRAQGAMTISVVDADGKELGSATSDPAKHGPTSVDVSVQTGSTYFIVVSGASGVTGPYCLQVVDDGSDAAAPVGDPSDDDGGDDSGDDSHPAPLTPAELFAKLDTNADGTLSLDEFSAAPVPKDAKETAADVFAKLDADSSGGLSLEEFAAAAPKPGAPDHQNGEHEGGRKGEQGPQGTPPVPEDLFTKLDTDEDGSLSLEEFSALPAPPHSDVAADVVFAAWDSDQSGLLSLEEFTAGLASAHKHI